MFEYFGSMWLKTKSMSIRYMQIKKKFGDQRLTEQMN